MQFRSSLFTKKLIKILKRKARSRAGHEPVGWKDEDRPDGVLRFMGNPSPNPHDDEKLDGEHGRESDDGGEREQPAVDLPALASLIAELSKWIAGAPWLEELDANPVIANADGFIIVDVRMRVSQTHLTMPQPSFNTDPGRKISS